MDEILTIEPYLAFLISGRHNFAKYQLDFKSRAKKSFHSLSVYSTASAYEFLPAFETATVTGPKFETNLSNPALKVSNLDTSAWVN
jgi:hypothetical protein